MTNTTATQPPAHAFPDQSFRTAPAPRPMDGALFLPASRHSALPAGASHSPARAAAQHTARALRAQGQTAWAGTQGGTWGVFLATPSTTAP